MSYAADPETLRRTLQETLRHLQESENRLRTLIDYNDDGVVILNRDGVIRLVNPAAQKLFRRDAAELIGQPFGWPLVIGGHTDIDLIEGSGDPVSVELRVLEMTWEGEPALVAELRDITERRRAALALEKARQFNDAVLDSLQSRIAVVNQDGVIVKTNRAWDQHARANGDPDLKYTGVGINYFDVCRSSTGEDSAEASAALAAMLAVVNGETDVAELEYACPENTDMRWFIMRVSAIRDEETTLLVIAHSDITRSKENTRQIAEAEATADQTQRRQREVNLLETMPTLPNMSVTSSMFSAAPLRESVPEQFNRLVGRVEKLLEQALEQRTYQVKYPISEELRAIADVLGTLKAGPRDVMDIYLTALKQCSSQAPVQKAQIYVEEGRVIVLELMGYLVSFYRMYLPPVLDTLRP